MKQVLEYYLFISIASIAAAYMLYVILLPLPAPQARALDFIVTPPLAKPATIPKSGTPVKLTVPSVGINMPVNVGSYNATTQSWTLDDSGIFYANTSVPANNTNGTTLLYGHARWGVFGALPDLPANAAAEIYTDTDLRFEYRYASVQSVGPTDTSVFTDQGKPKLVLQTCTGPWDAYRALYLFDFAGVKGE